MGRGAVVLIGVLGALTCAWPARAQRPVTLEQAVQAALTNGPRVALRRADSLAAEARLLTARAYPNPTIATSYTKSAPNYHLELEQPFEYPFLRAARIRAATLGTKASNYLGNAERASLRYEVEAAYANAAAAMMIRTLSTRNVAGALEMLRITREREKAGDASELEIRLAAVAAGQTELDALTDSLAAVEATLELQSLMGLTTADLEVVPVDSLDLHMITDTTSGGVPLRLAAAQQQVQIEQANVAVARASRIPEIAIRVGVEWHEPDASGLEPLIGVSLPMPFWNRNGGPIAEARAAEARANAELAQVQLQTQNAFVLARRQRALAQNRVERGRAVVNEAEKVAALSLTAYREGEYTLANVIEAQRNARDAVRSFIEAMQASRIAQAAVIRAQVVGGPVQ